MGHPAIRPRLAAFAKELTADLVPVSVFAATSCHDYTLAWTERHEEMSMRIGWVGLAVAIMASLAAAQTTVTTPGGSSSPASSVTSPEINSTFIADNFPGSDIGAQINHAVAACQAAGFQFCSISVNKSGTISTP